MKKSRFADSQIMGALKRVEAGLPVPPTSTANREIPSFLAGRPNEINDLQAIF